MHTTSRWIAGAFLALSMSAPASAQDADYPNRPIRVIVPFGAGVGVDTAARITADAAEKHLNQKFAIENKPGAGARLGAAMVANAAPRRLYAAVQPAGADRRHRAFSAPHARRQVGR